MITARVTHLEAFRRIMQTDFADQAELVQALKGTPVPPNWMMDAGTAFHAVLADPEKHRECYFGSDGEPFDLFESGDYTFSTDAVATALDVVGDGVCEVPGSKVYQTLHGPILITGTCDRIAGKCIRDAKAKFTTPHAGDYEQSIQWRLYLDLFGADCFTYDLFAFSQPKDGFCALRDIVSFKLWRYPSLEQDCERWVRAFVDWADIRNLLKHMQSRELVLV